MRRSALLLAAVSALALAACDSPATGLGEHELSVAAQQVASLAGEAEWLAQELRERRITSQMAWVHQQAIGDDAVKVARDLAKPVAPGLRSRLETVAQLDERLQAQVHRIAPASGDPAELESLQREFHALAGQARPLGQPS
jgi:hypothetical protein